MSAEVFWQNAREVGKPHGQRTDIESVVER